LKSEDEMNDHFIELLNVTKIYHQGDNPVVALDHINLKISKGEFLAITGKSGCGKSTLINIIGGLDSPDQGTIMIDGEEISQMEDRLLTLFRRDRIGIVFQFFNLLPILDLEENIILPHFLREGSNPPSERIDRLLREMGLFERRHHKPHELSGGEMQRVAICRALINDPEIILADEPTGNLDTETGEELFNLLMHLNKEKGITFIIVTHNESLSKRCHRTLRMIDGRIVST